MTSLLLLKTAYKSMAATQTTLTFVLLSSLFYSTAAANQSNRDDIDSAYRQFNYRCNEHWLTTRLNHTAAAADNATIDLRYVLCTRPRPLVHKRRRRPRAIFLGIGGEDDVWSYVDGNGFVFEAGAAFNAIVVFSEHRYYGESQPNLTDDDSSHRRFYRFLSTAEALADLDDLIERLHEKLAAANGRIRKRLPVILFGSSYAASLAAWSRLTRPDRSAGAIASSSTLFATPGYPPYPVDALDGVCHGHFYEMVTRDYLAESPLCAALINATWPIIDSWHQAALGWDVLSHFGACYDQNATANATSDAIDELKFHLHSAIHYTVMFDYESPNGVIKRLPARPVREACRRMLAVVDEAIDADESPLAEASVLHAVAQLFQFYHNGSGQVEGDCIPLLTEVHQDHASSTTIRKTHWQDAWDYQTCSEMTTPLCSTVEHDIGSGKQWLLANESRDCLTRRGIPIDDPMAIRHRYGSIEELVPRLTHIVLSSGDRDPWALDGLLPAYVKALLPDVRLTRDRSSQIEMAFERRRDLTALWLRKAAHHTEMFQTRALDAPSTRIARRVEKKAIARWLALEKSTARNPLPSQQQQQQSAVLSRENE